MGANTFSEVGNAATARAAFDELVANARHEYGHGGYTGTIAEKSAFVMIRIPAAFEPDAAPIDRAGKYADLLIEECDERIDDKWGPAGCIEVVPGMFVFFGWASS